MQRDLLLLLDYKGEFFGRHRHSSATTDLGRLREYLADHDLALQFQRFDQVDLRREDYAGRFVLYQSSQDPDLHYKGYIEDVMLALQLQGARLIPRFELFRAHHNKVFMELLRDLLPLPAAQTLRSRCFGTLEDLRRNLDDLSFPAVIKSAAGDRSKGVRLVETPQQALAQAKRLMGSFDAHEAWNNMQRSVLAPDIKPASLHRRKIVVQPYVAGLNHDYKVLAFGRRYVVVRRTAPEADFRASGSDQALEFPRTLPAGLLDLSRDIFEAFDAPYVSLDLLAEGERLHLVEMQFTRFGASAVLQTPHYFERDDDDGWRIVDTSLEWERAMADAIALYVDRKSK